jgi:hypothetical protein
VATKRARRPIFLSDEALAEGERLSAATGLSLLELVEALLGVNPDEPSPESPQDTRCLPSPLRQSHPPRPTQGPRGRVISIEDARARRSHVRPVHDDSPEPRNLPRLLEVSRDIRARAKALCQRSVDLRERSEQLAAIAGILRWAGTRNHLGNGLTVAL